MDVCRCCLYLPLARLISAITRLRPTQTPDPVTKMPLEELRPMCPSMLGLTAKLNLIGVIKSELELCRLTGMRILFTLIVASSAGVALAQTPTPLPMTAALKATIQQEALSFANINCTDNFTAFAFPVEPLQPSEYKNAVDEMAAAAGRQLGLTEEGSEYIRFTKSIKPTLSVATANKGPVNLVYIHQFLRVDSGKYQFISYFCSQPVTKTR